MNCCAHPCIFQIVILLKVAHDNIDARRTHRVLGAVLVMWEGPCFLNSAGSGLTRLCLATINMSAATMPHKTDDAALSSPIRSTSSSSSEVKDGRLLVNGRPSFRFGIYVYGLNASEWDTLESAGYTTVLTYTNGCPDSPFDCTPNYTRAFLDNAAERDMKVILSLKDYYNY